jgi:hypothetical protein
VSHAAIRQITEIIQNGYGDNSTTPLDRAVANQIVEMLYSTGWMDIAAVGVLVESAGGEIRVSVDKLMSDPPLIYRYDSQVTGEIVFKTRSKEEAVKEAKVNPNAERRIVDSGPIAITVEKRNADTGS